jgi:hypothetical protein
MSTFTKGMRLSFLTNQLDYNDFFTNISNQVRQPKSKWLMGFGQMGHLVNLNIKI